MELKDLIGKVVTCEKINALKDGVHPNGIDTGYTTGGILRSIFPVILIDTGFDYFHSSLVDHIEDNLVHTMNSIYKIEELIMPKEDVKS